MLLKKYSLAVQLPSAYDIPNMFQKNLPPYQENNGSFKFGILPVYSVVVSRTSQRGLHKTKGVCQMNDTLPVFLL